MELKVNKIDYIVVRIGDKVRVIFEDEFIDNNPFKTQNQLISSLKLLHNEKDFDVNYITHYYDKKKV